MLYKGIVFFERNICLIVCRKIQQLCHTSTREVNSVIVVENPVEQSDQQRNIFLDAAEEDVHEETWT